MYACLAAIVRKLVYIFIILYAMFGLITVAYRSSGASVRCLAHVCNVGLDFTSLLNDVRIIICHLTANIIIASDRL